ncbi:MAG: hypothetical protein K5799_05025 [Erythrobacter sp.]|nr:hypothetical protein [Erythrobacter sp.]
MLTSAFALSVPVAGSATETITYTYDAKGRLIKVEKQGSINNGQKTEYEHDKANNRKRVRSS